MKIIIADASPLYRQGVELVLAQSGVTMDALVAEDFSEMERISQGLNDTCMIIVDARLPGFYSLDALAALRSYSDTRILMLTDNKDIAMMRKALLKGVNGVVAKTAPLDELGDAIREVLEGGTWRYLDRVSMDQWSAQKTRLGYALCRLSNQENNVLNLVRCGLRNKQIADRMDLTEHTVKTHMSNILRKLEVENRTQLVVALQKIEISPAQHL